MKILPALKLVVALVVILFAATSVQLAWAKKSEFNRSTLDAIDFQEEKLTPAEDKSFDLVLGEGVQGVPTLVLTESPYNLEWQNEFLKMSSTQQQEFLNLRREELNRLYLSLNRWDLFHLIVDIVKGKAFRSYTITKLHWEKIKNKLRTFVTRSNMSQPLKYIEPTVYGLAEELEKAAMRDQGETEIDYREEIFNPIALAEFFNRGVRKNSDSGASELATVSAADPGAAAESVTALMAERKRQLKISERIYLRAQSVIRQIVVAKDRNLWRSPLAVLNGEESVVTLSISAAGIIGEGANVNGRMFGAGFNVAYNKKQQKLKVTTFSLREDVTYAYGGILLFGIIPKVGFSKFAGGTESIVLKRKGKGFYPPLVPMYYEKIEGIQSYGTN